MPAILVGMKSPMPRPLMILAALLITGAAIALLALATLKDYEGPVNDLDLDLTRPDGLIRSASLARLPRDLLRVPLLRDLLNESFVAYYEQHDDKLALSGTLRRIAYEHDLTLPDRLIETLFDEPAEMAFWRGGDGSLKHYALAMTRNTLAKALQLAARILPGDNQLRSAGKLLGGNADLYVVSYGYRRELLLAVRGDRLVVLSAPGMLLNTQPAPQEDVLKEGQEDESKEGQQAEVLPAPAQPQGPFQDPAAAKVVDALLQPMGERESPFVIRFGFGEASNEQPHRLAVSGRFLSFGYNAFFPGIDAMGFRFDAQGNWRTEVLMDRDAPAAKTDGKAGWGTAPHGASLCALLPVDWHRLGKLAVELGQTALTPKSFGKRFAGPASVCWFGDSRLFTPLFTAYLAAPADKGLAKSLAQTFTAGIGKGNPADRPEVVESERPDGAHLWQRRANSTFGLETSDEEEPKRFFQATLGLQGRLLAFSPDPKLVDRALDVAAKRFPAMGDSLPAAERTLALIDPSTLTTLLESELFEALPSDEEAVLRNAAEAHLIPRLRSLKPYPLHALVLSKENPDAQGWQGVDWQAVGK